MKVSELSGEVFIAGAGVCGKEFMEKAKTNNNIIVRGFIDNDLIKQGTTYQMLSVFSAENAAKRFQDAIVVIAIHNKDARFAMFKQLSEVGFQKIYNESEDGLRVVPYQKNEDGTWLPMFDYIETHVMNGCNMKCKGCTHFSNLFDTNDMVPFESFSCSMRKLIKVCTINEIRLLGGEPLLNKNILEYVKETVSCFPNADVRIVTNGILLSQCSLDLLSYMKEHDVLFNISWYSKIKEKKQKIEEMLKKKGVRFFSYLPEVNMFSRCLTDKAVHDAYISQNNCDQAMCHIYVGTKIYKCPMAAYIYKFNDKYQMHYPVNEFIDIEVATTDQLWQFAEMGEFRPIELCKFCNEKPQSFKWERSENPEKEEWLVH